MNSFLCRNLIVNIERKIEYIKRKEKAYQGSLIILLTVIHFSIIQIGTSDL